MRTLLLLCVLVAPLLAQGETKQEDKNEKIAKLFEQLQSEDPKVREKAKEELRTMALTKIDMTVTEVPADGLLRPGKMRVFVTSSEPGGSEVISGSSNGLEYKLTSGGGGRFKLSAKKEDGTTIEDEATMAELRKKYEFLRNAFAMRMPLAMTDGPAGWTLFPPRAGKVGILVRPASEELRHHLALPTGAGLVVHGVTPGSLADRIGLKRFDIVMRLDDDLIDSPKQLERVADSKGILEIIRRAKSKKIDLAKVPAAKKPLRFTK